MYASEKYEYYNMLSALYKPRNPSVVTFYVNASEEPTHPFAKYNSVRSDG